MMPGMPNPAAGPMGAPPQQASLQAPTPAAGPSPKVHIQQALALLKDDRMRTFEIVVETDATIAADEEKTKQETVEFMTAVGGFLEKALLIGAQVPAVVPLLGHLLLFGIRNFRIGREVEQRFEETVSQLEQQSRKMLQSGQGVAPQGEEADAKAQSESDSASVASASSPWGV